MRHAVQQLQLVYVCVQMVNAQRSAAQGCQPLPPLVCLEINEVGIKMSERSQVLEKPSLEVA